MIFYPRYEVEQQHQTGCYVPHCGCDYNMIRDLWTGTYVKYGNLRNATREEKEDAAMVEVRRRNHQHARHLLTNVLGFALIAWLLARKR